MIEHVFARTIYGEAEAHNEKDAYAVAAVIKNRAGGNVQNIEKVCLKPKQFSCWNKNDINRKRILLANDRWFERCKRIVTEVMSDDFQDPTNGATHYYANYIKEPKWVEGRKPCYVVSHNSGSKHLFFNDIPPFQKPLSKSRTLKGSIASGAAITAATTVDVMQEAQSQIEPLVPYMDTMKYLFIAVALIGIGVTIWARLDDRKKGIR